MTSVTIKLPTGTLTAEALTYLLGQRVPYSVVHGVESVVVPLNSQATRMEVGRLAKLIQFGLLLPDGSFQRGTWGVDFLMPRLRDGTEIAGFIERKLACGEPRVEVSNELERAAAEAVSQAYWNASAIESMLHRCQVLVAAWPYDADVKPKSVVAAPPAPTPFTAAQEERVRAMVREELGAVRSAGLTA